MQQEKYGGFFKKRASEKKPSARLIDRPMRPLFVEGFKHEVLVMGQYYPMT